MCGKGRMSFPHWPPTSFNEALFDNCLDEENTHRKHITRSWWAFVARIAAIRPWKQQIKQEVYIQKEREIRERYGIRFDEDTPVRHQKRKADCQGICEPTLRKKRYACLCHCGHHREECPVHQKNLLRKRKGAKEVTGRRKENQKYRTRQQRIIEAHDSWKREKSERNRNDKKRNPDETSNGFNQRAGLMARRKLRGRIARMLRNAKKDRYRKCQGKKQHYSLRESEKPTERRKPKQKIAGMLKNRYRGMPKRSCESGSFMKNNREIDRIETSMIR